jgi:hypothetical protein
MKKTFEGIRRTLLIGSLLALLTGTDSFAAFRDMHWGARPAGLAGAYSALADDSNAPAYNPAGLTQIRQTEATMMYARLFTGLNLYAGNDNSNLGLGYISFVPKPFLPIGNFGGYVTSFVAKSVYREETIAISWATQLNQVSASLPENLSIGATLRYLQHSYILDALTQNDPVFKKGNRTVAAGVDLGVHWEPMPNRLPGLRVAGVAKNINEPRVGLVERDRVPSEYHIGLAFQSPVYTTLTPTAEWVIRDGKEEFMGGMESWILNRTFGLRAGVNSREFGGGFSYRFRTSDTLSFQVDYTMMWPFYVEDTSGSHRVSLTARFGTAPMPQKGGVYEFKKGEWINQTPNNQQSYLRR